MKKIVKDMYSVNEIDYLEIETDLKAMQKLLRK